VTGAAPGIPREREERGTAEKGYVRALKKDIGGGGIRKSECSNRNGKKAGAFEKEGGGKKKG